LRDRKPALNLVPESKVGKEKLDAFLRLSECQPSVTVLAERVSYSTSFRTLGEDPNLRLIFKDKDQRPTATMRKEIGNFHAGGSAVGENIRLMQHEHIAQCVAAEMPAVAV
jgi:hypothetical protein